MFMSKEKNMPILRFFDYKTSPDWKLSTLGKISEPIKKRAGTQKYTLLSITSGIGLVSQIEKFGREIAGESYKNYIALERGDFAYNKSATKLFPEGYTAMLSDFDEGAVPNSIFTCFRITDKQVCIDFINHIFQSNYHGSWLRKFITVGARANGALSVDDKHLWAMPIALPTLGEQQKIADCLTSLDELIAAENKKLETLKSHKKGLMQKLFPAEGKTTPEWRFPDFRGDSEWLATTLEKVVDYENGKAHENEISEDGNFVVVNSKFISTEGEIKKYTNSANLLAAKGDILMVLSDVPNGRAIAKCFLVDKNETYTVNQRICRLIPKRIVGLLLFYQMNRNSYFLKFDDGIKQTNLRKDDVLACPIVLPKSLDEQQKIADFLSAVDEKITAQSEKIEALKQHKKGLMQGLFPSAQEVTK